MTLEAAHEHETTQGHLGMQIRINALEELADSLSESLDHDIANLDTVLQREMRLLDDETKARIEAIDDRIDSETDILERQVLDNRQDVNVNQERLSKLEVGSQARHDEQQAVINALEKRIVNNEQHSKELGHPHVQTQKFHDHEDRINALESN